MNSNATKMKKKPKETGRQGAQAPSRFSTILLFFIGLALVAMPFVASAAETAGPTGELGEIGAFWLPTLAAIVFVVFLNALFVAADSALELLRPSHIRALDKEDPRVPTLQQLLDNKGKFVAGCTLGSQTMRAWMMILCFIPARAFGPWLATKFGQTPSFTWFILAGVILSIPVAAFNLIFGELVPRSYGVKFPPQAAHRLATFVRAWTVLFSPVTAAVTTLAALITKRFGGRATFALANQAEEEIKNIVESAQGQGEIEEDERELLHSVFEFTDTIAREVMTPRVDLDSVSIDTPAIELMRLIQESGHSRIPVYEETDDQIIGIIHAKDLLAAQLKGELPSNLRTIMRPALFVPENKPLFDLMKEMKASRSQMAIVQDEFGGTSGIVTMEDIVEELVGDIVDEYDFETPDVEKNGTGYYVSGKMNLDDLNEEIGSEFDSEEFDTVGGYVFGLFGRQPKPGEAIENVGHRFTVEETDGRRILRLMVEPLHSDSEQPTITA